LLLRPRWSYEAKGEHEKAIDDLNTALTLYPRNAEGLSSRGKAYENLGDRDKALADFKAALAVDPGSEDARANLNRLAVP
jgi:Flp pilus assembly protein TadD